MKQTRILMGMPITVEIVDSWVNKETFEKIYSYFEYVDNKFSTYKDTSEISKYNRGEITQKEFSEDMKNVFELSNQTKNETNGYFDIFYKGKCDTSGLVKGWSIYNAANILKNNGYKNFYVDAGGDIQVSGKNKDNKIWSVGIQNPFKQNENIKVLNLDNVGVATSGTYIRGQHIYNPKEQNSETSEIVSLTVIGPNIYEADRFATAAFAMGKEGVNFIESLEGFEGYMIDKNAIATYTSDFERYIKEL